MARLQSRRRAPPTLDPNIQQAKPLVFGPPPQGTLSAVVEDQIYPVIANGVLRCMRDWIILMDAIELDGYFVIEGEGVPRGSTITQ
jgi:hypothetical protein